MRDHSRVHRVLLLVALSTVETKCRLRTCPIAAATAPKATSAGVAMRWNYIVHTHTYMGIERQPGAVRELPLKRVCRKYFFGAA